MSNQYALIENGVCVNIVVADADWAGLLEGEWILSTPTNIAWIGATFSNDKFQVIPRSEHLTDVFVAPPTESETPEIGE